MQKEISLEILDTMTLVNAAAPGATKGLTAKWVHSSVRPTNQGLRI
jgi:hypothetical protein